MANLHSIGQSIFLYSQNNGGSLIPGDNPVSWDVWGLRTSGTCLGQYKQVNLGYLLSYGTLPVPTNNDSVFFCPSTRSSNGGKACEDFLPGWEASDTSASITYMFNSSIDGFSNYVQAGRIAVNPHKNKINFLLGDSSVHTFSVKPLVFDSFVGPETLHEVSVRYGVVFPASLLHEWFEQGSVDLDDARDFLADPQGWAQDNCTSSESSPTLMATAGRKSLVCDLVGVWGPSPPAPGG